MADAENLLSTLDGHYQLHFAGRPRASRNLRMLKELQRGLTHVGGAAPLQEQARARGKTWQAEAERIDAAQQTLGEPGLFAAETLESAGRVLERVWRQSWQTPPEQLPKVALEGLQEDLLATQTQVAELQWPQACDPYLKASHARMTTDLASAIEQLQQWLARQAHNRGQGPALTRARLGIQSAQQWLQINEAQIEGRPRLVVRPSQMRLFAAGLEELAAYLEPLQGEGIDAAEHAHNCGQLRGQAQHWQQEARAAQSLRRQQGPGELPALLSEEADAILTEAEGRSEAGQMTSQQLATLCARMDEVHRQLAELPRGFGLGDHHEMQAGIADALAYLHNRLLTQLKPGNKAHKH